MQATKIVLLAEMIEVFAIWRRQALTEKILRGNSRRITLGRTGKYRVDLGEKFETRILLASEDASQPFRPFARIAALLSGKDQGGLGKPSARGKLTSRAPQPRFEVWLPVHVHFPESFAAVAASRLKLPVPYGSNFPFSGT